MFRALIAAAALATFASGLASTANDGGGCPYIRNQGKPVPAAQPKTTPQKTATTTTQKSAPAQAPTSPASRQPPAKTPQPDPYIKNN